MDKKFVGIVLNKIDYKEKDKLVKLFSANDGLVIGKLKGVKGASAKLKVLASPFCLAEFTAVETNGKLIITSGEVIDTFFDLTNDINKYYVGCCILDFVKYILSFQQDEFEKLFKIMLDALKYLCYYDIQPSVVLIKFLLNVLNFCGFNLNLEKCASCGIKLNGDAGIDFKDNSVKCCNCQSHSSITLKYENLISLKEINACAYEDIKQYEIKLLSDNLKILGNYIYCVLDYTIKIKELIYM